MHEIITLQLGQASNYIATHFWNTQESYFTYSPTEESLVDHDIHFRPGVGADGSETFTPRTLIYDLKGGFGSLRKINALYELEEPVGPQGVWNGAPVIQRQTAILQHPYQQSLEEGLDPPPLSKDSVRYWSDFNRVYFHPRSIVQLNEYELGSVLLPFENWSAGEELFNSLDKEHDLLDRDLRYFAEEADQMQGIQMMSGIDDAWGGFAARYIDRIRDEYGKTTVWFWGGGHSVKGAPREKRFLKLANTARSVSEISTQASLFVPLTVPNHLPNYVTLDPTSQWHVSGLLSTALESMTLPSRLKLQSRERETLDQLSVFLNVNGNQNIARLRMSAEQKIVPALNGHNRQGRTDDRAQSRDPRIPSRNRTLDGDESEGETDGTTLDIECSFSASSDEIRGRRRIKKTHIFGQAENYRGSEVDLADQDAERFSDVDGQQQARRRAVGLPLFHRTRIPLPNPVLDSFPHIFAAGSSPSSLKIETSLSTDTSVALWIKDLQSILSRIIGVDEREALSNSLGVMAESYEEGWDSGSDEDDD